MDTPTATGTGVLRRSCHFCRGRKIRCSGTAICSACQERGIDCVYDVQAGKGRPKGRSRKVSANTPTEGHSRANSVTAEEVAAALGSVPGSPRWPGPPVQNIEQGLEEKFDENFISLTTSMAPEMVFQKAIADFHRRLRDNPQEVSSSHGESLDELDDQSDLAYEFLFPRIRSDMMAMIASRFGSLGCELNHAKNRLSYRRGLLRDQTKVMNDPPYQGENPLRSLDTYRVLQLIDAWFSIHPLSPLVSKTLLMTSLRSNSVDEALLAIILADAISAHGTSKLYSGVTDTEEALFQFATTQVRGRRRNDLTLSTIQAVILIGWREMCRWNTRRSTCWFGMAGSAVSELSQKFRHTGPSNRQRMNGIEVGTVESELVRNMYWTTFSIKFWALGQLGAPFFSLLPKTIGIDFPPVNESASAVISLDLASDNISTLLPQSRSLRELWPLTHVACTMTHICALDPSTSDVTENLQGMAWQSRHLHKLRRLLTFDSEISSVCSKVCFILQEAIKEVEREVQDSSSQAVVLCAYRTIIIQLLFPRRTGDDPFLATTNLVQEFCRVVSGVPALARSISNSIMSSGLLPRDLSRATTVAETLALCLDACGRGLITLYEHAFSGNEAEYLAVAEYKDQLATFAAQLHDVSKADLSRTVAFIRPIKRRLKEAKQAYMAFSPHATDRPGPIDIPTVSTSPFGVSNASTMPSSSSASISDQSGVLPSLDHGPMSANSLPDPGMAYSFSQMSMPKSAISPPDAGDDVLSNFLHPDHIHIPSDANMYGSVLQHPMHADPMTMDNHSWMYMHHGQDTGHGPAYPPSSDGQSYVAPAEAHFWGLHQPDFSKP